MAWLCFNTIKHWINAMGITVSMSILGMYSNAYVYIHQKIANLYYSNKQINSICNYVFEWTHPVLEWAHFQKIEPFYDPWCSLFKGNEYYINLNKTEYWLPFFKSDPATNEKYRCKKHRLFCLNPLELKSDEQMCVLIQDMIHTIRDMWASPESCLITVKIKHQYISRITNDKNTPPVSLGKTRKHLLCVEYTHPEMKNSLYLDIQPGYYTEGNEVFSDLFVERCLKYQKLPYVFDSNYKLKIMDCMMRTVELRNNEYIILDKNDYKICHMETIK